MASPCLYKPPLASEPASHVKPITKQTFGRVSLEALAEPLHNTLEPNNKIESDTMGSDTHGGRHSLERRAHFSLFSAVVAATAYTISANKGVYLHRTCTPVH